MICQVYSGSHGILQPCTMDHPRRPPTSSHRSRAFSLFFRTSAIQAHSDSNYRRACDEELVRSRPARRGAVEKPMAADIQPSSTYLYRSRQDQLGHSVDDDWLEEQAGLPDEELSIEEDRRRTRAAAKDGLTRAAQVTAKAGQGFLKVALPVSGWAVRTGFAAAASAVGKARPKKQESPPPRKKSHDR